MRGFVVSLWLRIIGDVLERWAEVHIVVRYPEKIAWIRFKQSFFDGKGRKRCKVRLRRPVYLVPRSLFFIYKPQPNTGFFNRHEACSPFGSPFS